MGPLSHLCPSKVRRDPYIQRCSFLRPVDEWTPVVLLLSFFSFFCGHLLYLSQACYHIFPLSVAVVLS